MTTNTPSPAEQFASDFSSLQSKISSLQDRVRLNDARNAVENLATDVTGMPQRIANLRAKGYAFEKELENQAKSFVERWRSIESSAKTQLNTQSAALQNAMRPLETQLSQLAGVKNNLAAARPLLQKLETEAQNLEDKAEAAERSISSAYQSFGSEVSEVESHLEKLEWMIRQIGEASFQLMPTESGIMAVKAVWYQGDKEREEDPDGVLYLTDQRLIFEQKEEVATKKILFITTEKKKVQEKEWDIPISLLEETQTSKQGMFKNEDHLFLRFGAGSPRESVRLHIWQPCEEWQKLLNQAKAKEFDKTRAIAIDQKEVEKVKAVPAQCPSCGANLSQAVMRGQDSVKCEYCGYVIRL